MVTFTNNGNTCYFNSLMQIMLHIRYVPSKSNKTSTNWFLILNKLKRLNPDYVFNPSLLFDYLKWKKYFSFGAPHDIHEALLQLLEIVGNNSFLGEFLEVNVTREPPFTWYFNHVPMTSIELSAKDETLTECFNNFFATEIIEGLKDDNNIERSIFKSTHISKYPENLVLVIKQNYRKKEQLVYTKHLDIRKFTTKKTICAYSLNVVVIHKMGHYYTYCNENNIWYCYDDDKRYKLYTNAWMLDPPYMLIYTRILE